MPPLTKVKQEKFCINYFKCGNATEAALVAGYSPKTAQQIASENLLKPLIQARLKELQLKVETAGIMTVVERKRRLSEIAEAKLTDFMELGQDGSWVNIGPETPKAGAIQEIHSRTEYDDNGAHPTVHTSVKLHSPIQAIQELNKMEKVYDDSPKIAILNQTIIHQNNLSSLSDEELTILERIVEKTALAIPSQNGDISP